MKNKILKIVFFTIVGCLFNVAGNTSASDIIQAMEENMRGESRVSDIEMKIVTRNWSRTLKMKSWEKGRTEFFTNILSPAKEKGISTLKIDNQMWNYLPNIDRVIKIPPSMMKQKWMGSDFTNDDLVRMSSLTDDYIPKVLETKEIDEKTVHIIELTPKMDAPVVWGKLLFTIIKDKNVPIQQDYYDENGKLVQILKFSNFKTVDGRLIPMQYEMEPQMKKNKKTIISFSNVKFNVPIDNTIFSVDRMKGNH